MANAKISLLILLFLVLSLSSIKHSTEARTENNFVSSTVVIPKTGLHTDKADQLKFMLKERIPTKSRKLLEDLAQLDYDYAGPNPKHDPRKGRGGRNL